MTSHQKAKQWLGRYKSFPYKAVSEIVNEAMSLGIDIEIIEVGRERFRQSGTGQTHSPRKVVMMGTNAFSIGGARQYLAGKNQRCAG